MVAPSKLLRDIGRSKKAPLILLLSALLLLRRRLANRAKKAFIAQRLSPEALENATRQLYVDEPDGSRSLLVPFRGRVEKVPVSRTPESVLKRDARNFPRIPSSHKPNVDRTFIRQLVAIFRIAFPSLNSREVAILLLHSAFLVLRTVLSVGVAKLDGRIVRDLVSADGPGFLRGLGWWFAFAIPSTYTNSMLRYLQSKLALRLRTRLTSYTHDLYLSSSPSLRYYRISQHGGLEGVDQYITTDIASFCDSLAALYGNVMKPTLDMFIFTAQLSRSLGFRGTVLLFANYYVTVGILRAVTPAFGKLAAVEAMLEGEYRTGMNRIGRESEEIAFYNGGTRERGILREAYLRLVRHINSIYKLRIGYEWTEDFVIKYLWSAAGYCLISIPILLTRRRNVGVQAPPLYLDSLDNAVADRTENYISSRRLLLSLADAGGRLMYAYKDVLELAGYTTRLYTLLSTLHHLPSPPPPIPSADTVALHSADIAVPGKKDTVLVRGLRFKLTVGKGEHLMITGTNGVGKTAVARVVAGLWAGRVGNIDEEADEGSGVGAGLGLVERPPVGVSEVFIVPQRAYMVTGTLLDQMIYPHSYTQFLKSGRTEDELMEILESVHLAYLPSREGGWATKKEWRDVLSGGEKQRMGLARVMYHRPKFALLDECTSAVSSDVEGRMYEHAKSLGITLITISLRPTLIKYHTHLLTLNGDAAGSWTCTRVSEAEERMELDREILDLEAKLADVGKWEARVSELERMLGTKGDVANAGKT